MPDEDPRPAELGRQIHEVRVQLGDFRKEVGQRFDRMPTTEIMMAYLTTRDLELKTISEDVKDLVAAQAQERVERMAAVEAEKKTRENAVQKLSDKVDADRRHARAFALSILAAITAIVGVIVNAGGLG